MVEEKGCVAIHGVRNDAKNLENFEKIWKLYVFQITCSAYECEYPLPQPIIGLPLAGPPFNQRYDEAEQGDQVKNGGNHVEKHVLEKILGNLSLVFFSGKNITLLNCMSWEKYLGNLSF